MSAGGPGGGAQTPYQAPATTPGVPSGTTNPAPLTNQNLNQIVTDYLKKKGYNRTEEVFRQEVASIGPDGRPHVSRIEDSGPKRYLKAFNLLKDWVENNLDIYKFELSKLLWPVFVYSWLELVERDYMDEAKNLLTTLKPYFESVHADDLKTFSLITLPQHAKENAVIRQYRENKYRIPLNSHVTFDLFHFLERESAAGGSVVRSILQTYCQIDATERGPIDVFSFEAIYRRSQNVELDDADVNEGIPGHFTGLSNRNILDSNVPLTLGPMPMEAELREDVRAELEEEDQLRPPREGQMSLVDEFDKKIKREDSADVPNRADVPLPPSRARDILMEMQKVRENRDRFKIDSRTNGVGTPCSALMYTFHNTLGNVSSMDLSNDQQLVAVGTMDSYIRVWSLDGKPLPSKVPSEKDEKINNRKLVGHSAPVYSVAFSDAIANLNRPLFGEVTKGKDMKPLETNSKLLLSASADGTVRLWSLEVWACMCIYKSHEGPVMRCLWGPHGHYFLTGGWDKTVRVWMQDHASPVRLLVGHNTSISAIAWHPNGVYVFSASDETDKTIRMWSIVTGDCVRVFTGHNDYISALEVAENGQILASADAGGNIMFWDIAKGTRIKRSRGHGKGGIYSLSFCAESNTLVSGGLDGTVRIWDVEMPADGHKVPAQQQTQAGPDGAVGDSIVAAGVPVSGAPATGAPNALGASASAAGAAGGTGAGVGGTGKKKGKEVMITPDQISAWATKKTPVRKVMFTRMNLVIAAGCYDPDR